jgi:hypothetical protein
MKKEKNWKTGHDEPLTIRVTIGRFDREYILVETTAPRSYDGHGTLEMYTTERGGNKLADLGPIVPSTTVRFILVEKEHVSWQEGRNHSGLYTFETQEDALNPDTMIRWAEDKLYKRLTRNEEE